MSNARYARTSMYSESLSKGLETQDVNKKADFFANIDLDLDDPINQVHNIPKTDGPDSAIDVSEKEDDKK